MSTPANKRSTFYRQPQRLNPVLLGPDTILSLSRKRRALENVMSVLNLLEPDDFIEFMLDFYEAGLGRFGDDWRYADQLTVLFAAASLLQVENYLEIGVFRGRSFALLASLAADAKIFGFDLWAENYAGLENPGPEFVRGQLARVGFQGEATFISGRSQETLPAFLDAHPDLFFDLVTVDGDHRFGGAHSDLQNVLPRVKVGGVLVFDDICHPKHLALEYVWDDVVGSNPNFMTAKYTDVGNGVALAVRTEAGDNLDAKWGLAGEQLQAQHESYPGSSEASSEADHQPGSVQEKLHQSGSDRATLLRTIRNLDGALRESETERTAQLSMLHDLEARLQGCELDRAARLDINRSLENKLQECEADRSSRLDVIHSLENKLQECEADRSSRLDVIHSLENKLQECEVDRSSRLDVIHSLENKLQECEADRSARLDVTHSLENMLQECEADRSARLDVIHSLENKLQECEVDRTIKLEAIQNLEELRDEHVEALNWGPVRALLNIRRKSK